MDVRYITINEEDLTDLPIIDGQIIALADTPRWYYDMDDTRYSLSGTIHCSFLPPVDKALNGVIYLLDLEANVSDDENDDTEETVLGGAYLFLDGRYIKVSQLYNPASATELGLVKVGTNIDVTTEGVISIPSSRIRSIAGIASTFSPGLVQIGSGLNVTPAGVLSVPVEELTAEVIDTIKTDPSVFPVSSKDSIGVVRIGDNINVDEHGLISMSGQNVIDALGFTPGQGIGTTAAIGSIVHPIYYNGDTLSTTSQYLDVWTTGNGKAASYSTSEGNMTTASGQAAHSEGNKTLASNVYTHAGGNMSTASGIGSFAHGYLSVASNQYAEATGNMSTASGSYSIAKGNRAKASRDASVAIGSNISALGSTAVAIGTNVQASTTCSMIFGTNSTASQTYQTVIGSYGKPIERYSGRVFMTEYLDYGTAATSPTLSTFAYGDNSNQYMDIHLASKMKPYPLTGLTNSFLEYNAVYGRPIPKPGDTKDRYYKKCSTYSYSYPTTKQGYSVRYPVIVNSGTYFSNGNKTVQWSPIITRLLCDEAYSYTSPEVIRASTIISGLMATDVQPILFARSFGPEEVHIMTLPDKYGSLVIFKSYYDTCSGASATKIGTMKWGTTYYKVFYVVPSDGEGAGDASSANWTQYGCVAIQLGAGAVGGSKKDACSVNWLNGNVLDDSEALHYEKGQFAFWCNQKDTYNDVGNGTAYEVTCAIYSLPAESTAFGEMLATRYE